MLGICYGMYVIAQHLGAHSAGAQCAEYGPATLDDRRAATHCSRASAKREQLGVDEPRRPRRGDSAGAEADRA